MSATPRPSLGAVILAGGTAARMDGVDKSSLEVGGRTLLEHALEATTDIDEVVVVMPDCVPTSRPVTVVLEDPPYGGPVAGLLTGFEALARTPDYIVVLAVDMPWVSGDTIARLCSAVAGRDGAFLSDSDGRRQLAGVVSVAALESADPGVERRHGLSMQRLLAQLDLAVVEAQGREAGDLDTWADVIEARGEDRPTVPRDLLG